MLASAPPNFRLAWTTESLSIRGIFPVIGEDDISCLYRLGNGQRLQIVDHSGQAVAPVALIPLSLEGFDRLESVHRLLSALHGRAVRPDPRLTPQQRMRMRRMLQAFDGYRDGATQQEIARVVLRLAPLDRDAWQVSSARHAVKALLRDARAMIAGGYRRLLRHRRPI